jgi:hypothetical protein
MEDVAPDATRRIALGDMRFLVIDEIRRLLAEEKQAAERAASPEFVSREKAQLIRRKSLGEATSELSAYAELISAAFPALADRARSAQDLARKAQMAASGEEMMALIQEVIEVFDQSLSGDRPTLIVISGDADGVVFSIGAVPKPNPIPELSEFEAALAESRQAQAFLAAVSATIEQARVAARRLGGVEQFARAAAYQALELGTTMPPAFRGIGVSGFRLYQTSLSLADPGEGHNLVTCLDARLLAGTVVHIEHIDRGKETDREIVEAYRLPAPLNAGRVRLQIGTAAPCTAYVGRTPFENGPRPDAATYVPATQFFEEDLLKAAHMTASACSVMFANGIADCKIAMERMTASQLIRFMVAVAGNVSRDRSRQFLSAAFNLNVPILDDRIDASPRWIGSKYEIAKLAIEIAVAGGFEKVTWDGSSNLPTSEPIILSFSDAQWLELIHRAHEVGLETYVSAGMDKKHMPACVYSGVDGVGIGTSLHYRKQDANGKYVMGELKPDAILEVLQVRDDAVATPRGRGAAALATLDRLFFEQILPTNCDALRGRLFAVLSSAAPSDEAIQATLSELESLAFWTAMSAHKKANYLTHPVIAQAQRKLVAVQPHFAAAPAFDEGPTHILLRQAVSRSDITDIMEILR